MPTKTAILAACLKYQQLGYNVDSIVADVLREDARGEGVACGNSFISPRTKCSKGKASTTPKEALQRTTEKAKARQKLRAEVEGRPAKERKGKLEAEGLNLSHRPSGKPGHITTTSYRNKGTTGYLAKLEHKGHGEVDRQFQNSSSADPETYRGKMGQQHYDLAKLKDGIYEAESKTGGYNTRSTHKFHFEVKGGKVTRHFEDLKDAKENGLSIQPAAKGLSALEGSDKQVSWANTIREKALTEAHKIIQSVVPEKHQERFKRHLNEIAAEKTHAKHWIDNRDNAARPMLKEAEARIRAELN